MDAIKGRHGKKEEGKRKGETLLWRPQGRCDNMSSLLARWAAAAAGGLGSMQVASFRKVPYYGAFKSHLFHPRLQQEQPL